ncbi:MAG: hypothetical protein GF418_03400, partial [Chitinivibrionales bacterium]|nr:hypothetical protein [Chitinivibrionales bacterium]MBD3394649.1 hypothetical protein [Chitinivibrionales bacterium]
MKKVKDALARPAPDCRPWALWLWNKQISELDLIDQLNSFVENGFGGVAIRPSRDMDPAYLSEEFFEYFELVLATAKSVGFGVRLADDFALPFNDFFEGLAQYDSALRARQLTLEHAEIVPSRASFERAIDDPDSIYVLATGIKNDRIDPKTVKVLAPARGVDRVSFKATGGDWQVMVLRASEMVEPDGHFIPNPFNSVTAHTYVQEVLEEFTGRFSKYAPATFQGIVTEVPACLPAENAIPWDSELVARYHTKFKKDLVKTLPVLFLETEDTFARERVAVYSFMAQLMHERFAGVLESWAKKHRLSQWVLGPERNVLHATNALRDCLAVAPVPLASYGVQNQEGTESSAAVVRSVADSNAIEHKRETVSVIGRNHLCAGATLQSLKTEIDLHALNGPSRVLLDGCFFNLDHRSHVRTPFNPSWYYPAWDQTVNLCAYSARLAGLLKTVHFTRPAAVIMPSSSLTADYLPGNNESIRRGTGLLAKTIAELQRLNVDYDIVSEELFVACSIRANGEFSTSDRIRKGRYQVAIIPYSRLINRSVFVQVEKLTAKKGTAIFIADPPQGNLDDGISPAFTQRVEKLLRTRKKNVHVAAPKELSPFVKHIPPAARVSVSGKRCPDIYAAHGSGSNYEVYVLHNMAERRDFFATVQLPAARHFYLADCLSGELHELKNVQREGKMSTMGLTFAPRVTYIIAASSTKITTANQRKTKSSVVHKAGTQPRNYRIVLKDQWAFTPNDLNVLPLANWNTRIGLSRESGGYSHYCESYFEAREIPDTCVFTLCGFPVQGSLSESAGKTFELAVNGNVVEPMRSDAAGENQPELFGRAVAFCGPQSAKYDIRHLLVKGFNRVSVRTVSLTGDPTTIVYPPLIAGSFAIARGTKGWTIDRPLSMAGYDSWTKYGFPYLSGSGTYRQDFELPSGYKRIVLKFTHTSGPVEVFLNQKSLGTFSWHPMEIDITSACEQRRNTLEVRVMNTMDNVLRMNGRP